MNFNEILLFDMKNVWKSKSGFSLVRRDPYWQIWVPGPVRSGNSYAQSGRVFEYLKCVNIFCPIFQEPLVCNVNSRQDLNLLRSKSGDDLLGKSFADERRATFSIATNVITGANYKKNSRPDSSSSEDPSETDVAGEVNHLHLR